jgi:hypothetical protein
MKKRKRCYKCERLHKENAALRSINDSWQESVKYQNGRLDVQQIELQMFRDLLGSLVDEFMVRRSWTPPTDAEKPTVEASFR